MDIIHPVIPASSTKTTVCRRDGRTSLFPFMQAHSATLFHENSFGRSYQQVWNIPINVFIATQRREKLHAGCIRYLSTFFSALAAAGYPNNDIERFSVGFLARLVERCQFVIAHIARRNRSRFGWSYLAIRKFPGHVRRWSIFSV